MSTLSIHDLRKSYGALEVLRDINLEARQGEFIALVGPSGCGKSTLLGMIAGLETVSSGQIRIDGRLVNDVAPRDRDIAMVFQSYALYPTMTVRENMAFGMESRGVPRAEQESAIRRVAALLQIEPLLNRKPSQLSGGQRQRVAMGRALVRDPKLFLFDEPLSNLDAKLRVEMRTEIKKLHHRVAKTTIYVTHDQVEAMTLASRIAVMHRGVLQQFDEPQAIYERPANLFVAGFMGSPSMNVLPAVVASLDGGPAVEVLDGLAVLPLPPGTPLPKAPGQPVILGLRPEHFVVPHRAQPEQTVLGRLRADVEVVEPTGSETMVVLRLGSKEITARYEPVDAPRVGETVEILVDMAKACLFDPATERLL
ncbi:ABC transporter ATP-binding protein [Rubellimicrobium roseum]|uniref:ABC transporter ATP-binding protein n=1 Tax=Rubellimicrobium roseum TaxID=687525 RepID=A0A5C4NIN9_9RHOB|nr:ABC transporter ATP-binding protein [Rubellimicrobium roseum]TNC73268.1 ABC transporter ATP-binding protein [Rubellimicrobium roseum]